ncbi:hypothetical protein DVH24_027506 [Malus domestica]|uniref:Uncharacterized protein n=1 Tax=Malus domestica TaxID=3750 RepID=A0A498KQL3_MALDO|nr:hypothetical protein DVH24_027506 [Malus domestica]
MLVCLLNLVVDSVTHWFATTVLGLPRIQSRIQSRICSKDNSRLIQYKGQKFLAKVSLHKAIELWKTNMRHPQASEVVNKDIISHFVLRLCIDVAVDHSSSECCSRRESPLIGEPTPLTESTPTTSQVPVSSTSSVSVEFLSARRPHRRRREPEPSDHPSSSSRVEDGASQPAKKNTRGPNRMLKELQLVRMSASLIKIAYDERHRGAVSSQQHNIVVNCCGFIIRNFCPMRWGSWAKIPEETRTLVRDNLETMPAPNVAPPSTSQPFCPDDTE